MSKLISFAISDDGATNMTPEDIEKMQFQKIHFRIYSNALNAHGYLCSLKVLKKYANTISGKPILAYYNAYANGGNGDFGGHENSSYAQEIAVGFFPNDCKVTYEKGEDGTVYLCADGYIWNVYYSHIVNVFEHADGIKGVSSEMLIIESELDEETGIENILQYSFTGVTLLGDCDAMGSPIKPAVDGCNGEIATFSTSDEYAKAKMELERVLYNSVNQESNKGSFFNTKNKEEVMEKEITNSTSSEVVENAEKVVATEVKVSTDVAKYDDNGRYVGEEHETHKKEVVEVIQVPEEEVKIDEPIVTNTTEDPVENATEEVVENSETEVVENATEDVVENTTTAECTATEEVTNSCIVENSVSKEEYDKLVLKCSALEKELAEKKTEFDALTIKCNTLEEYKFNKESEIMKNSIECAISNVSHILNADQINEWREKSLQCSIDNVDEFINGLKAFAFDVQEKNGVQNVETIRNSIPKDSIAEPTDMWERLSQKYK